MRLVSASRRARLPRAASTRAPAHGGGWLACAGAWRVMAETGLLAFALTLPLAAILRPALGLVSHSDVAAAERRWPVMGLSMLYVGLFAALLGALRLRRFAGSRRRLWSEVRGGLALTTGVWTGAFAAHVAGSLWAAATVPPGGAGRLSFVLLSPVLAAVSAAAALHAYVWLRAGVLAWPVWDRLRRTRLLWALTHAQVVAAVALATGFATLIAVLLAVTNTGGHRFGPPFGPADLPTGTGAAALTVAWVTTRLLPFTSVLLVVAVGVSVAVLPPAALISYTVLRRITGRLEDLAAGAAALRAGNLAARVPVGGEDEVARLQASFNTMAADLERTLGDLAAERDRVSGLLDARRQLIAGVSHELRTPVATVRGYVESALRRDEAPAGLRTDLETMEREAERLQRLIDDLFTLARATVGRLELRPEPVDTGAVVRRLVATMAPLAWGQRRVQLVAEATPALPPVHADAQRLEQIVSNLVGNAVRHTLPGGLVAVVVAAEPDGVRIEVRDTGDGIAPEDLPYIFERFYRGRAEEESGGAGLGLALAKEMTEAMGGTIAAASVPGEGSCFTIRLPFGVGSWPG